MKILILAGGTGSIALQKGLDHISKKINGHLDIKILVNGYDDGLSTGVVRRVMGGKILGPSDIRKNQTTQYCLKRNPNEKLVRLLNDRISLEYSEVKDYCETAIYKCGLEQEKNEILISGLDKFFSNSTVAKIDFIDFSIANIIYAGLAALNNNSMRAAAREMASVLDIPDNVIINDDRSLFLRAITRRGKTIANEGDIVSWNNAEDPIVRIHFCDDRGKPATPKLCKEAEEAILDADYIILSSGTQWSSLIPTYESIGFKNAIKASIAKVIMVMNRMPDKDAPGTSAGGIIESLVTEYFDFDRLNVIIDEKGHTLMRDTGFDGHLLAHSINEFDIGQGDKPTTHDAHRLALAVLKTMFRDYLDADYLVFDYDDTLVGRGNSFSIASKVNVASLYTLPVDFAICSGNGINSINLKPPALDPKTIKVYADGGVNRYDYFYNGENDSKSYAFKECIAFYVLLDGVIDVDEFTQHLHDVGIPAAKIENRGNASISIKPIDPEYREIVYNLVKSVVERHFDDIALVKMTGRTTIEVVNSLLNKSYAILHILDTEKPTKIVYVGDEFYEGGNDMPVKDVGVSCLAVKNPADTALFLMAVTDKNV